MTVAYETKVVDCPSLQHSMWSSVVTVAGVAPQLLPALDLPNQPKKPDEWNQAKATWDLIWDLFIMIKSFFRK